MKKTMLAISLAVFSLAGCSSPSPAANAPEVNVPPASTPSPTPTPTPTGPKTNERGNVVKKVGEVAYLTNAEGKPSGLQFKVTSIKRAVCDANYPLNIKGTPLAVTLEVVTTPDFRGAYDTQENPTVSFDPNLWRGYAANGTRMNKVAGDVSYGCFTDPSKFLPMSISKGEKVSGTLVFDVATPTGSIAYSVSDFNTGGWEYAYSVK
jgi:hypothetical protein